MSENSKISKLQSEPRLALPERLREAREYLGLSQELVSEQTGISRAAVSAIENGKRRVEALELQALAKLYRHPVGYFLGDETEIPDTIKAIAREATNLTDRDREEVLRFARFLRGYGQEFRGQEVSEQE